MTNPVSSNDIVKLELLRDLMSSTKTKKQAKKTTNASSGYSSSSSTSDFSAERATLQSMEDMKRAYMPPNTGSNGFEKGLSSSESSSAMGELNSTQRSVNFFLEVIHFLW